MLEQINHPAHYNQSGIECIDAIEAALTPDEFIRFLKGQILKYTWRTGHKDKASQDFAKAEWYLQKVKEFLTKKDCVNKT